MPRCSGPWNCMTELLLLLLLRLVLLLLHPKPFARRMSSTSWSSLSLSLSLSSLYGCWYCYFVRSMYEFINRRSVSHTRYDQVIIPHKTIPCGIKGTTEEWRHHLRTSHWTLPWNTWINKVMGYMGWYSYWWTRICTTREIADWIR